MTQSRTITVKQNEPQITALGQNDLSFGQQIEDAQGHAHVNNIVEGPLPRAANVSDLACQVRPPMDPGVTGQGRAPIVQRLRLAALPSGRVLRHQPARLLGCFTRKWAKEPYRDWMQQLQAQRTHCHWPLQHAHVGIRAHLCGPVPADASWPNFVSAMPSDDALVQGRGGTYNLQRKCLRVRRGRYFSAQRAH